MNSVFVLEHLHLLNGDEEDVKMLGVYSTREKALEAVERFKQLSGFRDTPQMAVYTDAPGNRRVLFGVTNWMMTLGRKGMRPYEYARLAV